MRDRVLRQFNRSAEGSYDVHASVQRGMADRLAQALTSWKNAAGADYCEILEIGCGTGNLTEIMVKEWPDAIITALDLAPAMIEAAKRRFQNEEDTRKSYSQPIGSRLTFLQADIEVWAKNAKPASFDLVVSNACFQWLRDPEQTLVHLRRLLRSGGLLAFTTFGPDTFHELHQTFYEVYDSYGYKSERHGLAFRSFSEWKTLLEQAGFVNIQYERLVHQEKYASARDFLHSVKGMGASASEAAAIPGLALRQLFDAMFKKYDSRYSVPGGVAATYDILHIEAVCGN